MGSRLLASTPKAPSAAELARQLQVTAKTAWLLRRKIQHAMARGEGGLMLRGIVELDEAFVGGKEPGSGRRGRGQPHKTLVLVAASQSAKGGLGAAHLEVIEDAKAATLLAVAKETIAPGTAVRTDGYRGYGRLGASGYEHHAAYWQVATTSTSGSPGRTSCSPTSSAGFLDIFHGVSPAHLQAYLDEFCYRLNVADSARISSVASSTAVCSTPSP